MAYIPLRTKFRPKLISPKLKAPDTFVYTVSYTRLRGSRTKVWGLHTFHLINGAENRNAGEKDGYAKGESMNYGADKAFFEIG